MFNSLEALKNLQKYYSGHDRDEIGTMVETLLEILIKEREDSAKMLADWFSHGTGMTNANPTL